MKRALLILLLAACSSDKKPPPPDKKPVPAPTAGSGWHEMKLPVAYGKKLPCEKLIDADKMGAALGKKLVLVDDSKTDGDATAYCTLKLAGSPPSKAEQARLMKEKGSIGQVGGDDYCSVGYYCSYAFDATSMKHDCDEKHLVGSAEIGDYTCVQQLPTNGKMRAIVSVLDSDTKCKVVAHAGNAVFDETITKLCAKSAADLLGPEQIAP
jgi:hypothetical protein